MNKYRSYIPLVAGPMAALLIWFFTDLDPTNPLTTRMAGIAVWMSIWWISEAVNLAVTALLPLVLLPLMKIAPADAVAPQYTDSIIFLFVGGFMLAFAIEKWGLHKRIALKILSLIGSSPNKILFGVMLSSYLISNWISNTATTIMLLSAVLSLISVVENHLPEEKEKNNFAAALLLGLAFSATIGGMATPVGTPPNMFFFKEYHKTFSEQNDLNFLTWAKIGFPLSFTFLLLTFYVLRKYYLASIKLQFDKKFFKEQLSAIGKPIPEEKIIGFIFMACVLLWFTREKIEIGNVSFSGWGSIFGDLISNGKPIKIVSDATVAVTAAILLFLIPSVSKSGEKILEWEDAKKLRYDIILMFGGGFALAYGFKEAGLDKWLADSLYILKGTHPVILCIFICLVICIISEFASNIASIQLAMPVMVALQPKLGIHPLLLMIPATFAASLGFILPVATAANTIVFGTKRIFTRDMFYIGLILDLAGILLITLFTFLLL